MVDGDLEPVLTLRSESYGQRHVIFPAPDGVLVDVITPIPFADGPADGPAGSSAGGSVGSG